MSELQPPDLTAYADFVCFVSRLASNISVHLVPGADGTLALWILSVMMRYAPRIEDMDATTSFCNTTWELFFRLSGLNVRTSLILAHEIFREFGAPGLAKFLAMTEEEQIAQHTAISGLKRPVTHATSIWNDTSPTVEKTI
jgi:hypothetical protein